ncbi:hypothetical protein LEMLEM_LOCUS22362 [Lemmus lemmus]
MESLPGNKYLSFIAKAISNSSFCPLLSRSLANTSLFRESSWKYLGAAYMIYTASMMQSL